MARRLDFVTNDVAREPPINALVDKYSHEANDWLAHTIRLLPAPRRVQLGGNALFCYA